MNNKKDRKFDNDLLQALTMRRGTEGLKQAGRSKFRSMRVHRYQNHTFAVEQCHERTSVAADPTWLHRDAHFHLPCSSPLSFTTQYHAYHSDYTTQSFLLCIFLFHGPTVIPATSSPNLFQRSVLPHLIIYPHISSPSSRIRCRRGCRYYAWRPARVSTSFRWRL